MERLTLVITGETRAAVEDALERIALDEGVSARDTNADETDDGTSFVYSWNAATARRGSLDLTYADLDRICGALRGGGGADEALLLRLRQLRAGATVHIVNPEEKS